MQKAESIIHLFPAAKPGKDFQLLDSGTEFILREGKTLAIRVEIPLEEGQEPPAPGEEVEGIHFYYRIRSWDELTEGVDYDVVNRGQYIAVWNVKDENGDPVPQPNDEELQAAWDDLQENPPIVPPTPEERLDELETESVSTMLAVTEAYEQQLTDNVQREQEGIDTMLALTESYELILQQQAAIIELQTRIAALEGGDS